MHITPLADERLKANGWIGLFFLLIPGLSILVALKSNTSPVWPLFLWVCISVVFIFLVVRPKPLEILFFSLPLLYPIAPALTGFQHIYTTIGWLIILSTVFFIQGCISGWKHPYIRASYALPLLLYAVVVTFSTVLNPMHTGSLSSFGQCITLVPIYWVLLQVTRGQNLQRLMIAIIFGTLAGSIIYLIAYSQKSPQLAWSFLFYGPARPSILHHNPNAWGVLPLIGLPILLGIFMNVTTIGRNWIWIMPGCLSLILVAILTMSRSAVLAIGISVLFVLLHQKKGRRLLLIFSMVTLFLALVLYEKVGPHVEKIFRLQAGLSGRGQLWGITWALIEDNPIFGLGPSGYSDRLFFYTSFIKNGLIYALHKPSAHNLLLQVGVDVGIAGSIIILFIFFMFAYKSRLLWKSIKSSPSFTVLVGISAAMIAGIVRGFFEVDFAILHGFITENLLLLTLLAFKDQLIAQSSSKL